MSTNDLTLLDSRIRARHKSVAPEMPEHSFFDLFVAEQVLKNYQPNLDGLLYGIVDGEGDCGIDGFYAFVNDQQVLPGMRSGNLGRNPRIDCVILQCKTSPNFAEAPLEKLSFHLPQLLAFERDESALAASANPRLLEATRNFLTVCSEQAPLNPLITFYVFYATRGGQIHPNLAAKAKSLKTNIRNLIPGSAAEVTFLGAGNLLEYAQKAASVSLNLPFSEGPMASESAAGQGYVVLVRLDDYCRFLQAPDGSLNASLFEANVRDHEGATEVNRSITETLVNTEQLEDFWWLNNGITIVAPTVQQMGKRLYLVDPQVVNGLQTSNEIYHYFATGGSGGERQLLVRVIAAEHDLVSDKILRATNKQNQLPGSALRATDPLQHKIEEYFHAHGFWYDRRKNYYANLGKPLDKIVSMESLAQSVASCLLRQPWLARARYASMLDDDLYPELFSETYSLNMYLNCLLLTRRVRSALRGHEVDRLGELDDWVFHVSTVASMLSTRKTRPNHNDLANAPFASIPPARFGDLVPVVAREYARGLSKSSYVPFSSVASEKGISEALVKRAESMLISARWRGWPDEPVDEDAAILKSDVLYARARRS